ncbi:MAG: sugar phosphate isomerase/epimerase [Lachnospiraceae bacterium]|nr:sugar phosphate isomerase/epimerase [Lachnospiraceae bacterium]
MKLGFVSSILDQDSFEDVVDTAADLGLECVELACWPGEKAERRYAGVSHIDTENLSDEKIVYIKEYCKKKKVEISSLAYYPNPLDSDKAKQKKAIDHLYSLIDASSKLNVNMVTTFVGRDQNKTVEENLALVKIIWPPILEYARDRGVKVAIENCPMLFGPDQWPGGQNLMTSPYLWEKIWEILPYDNFGLNFDPSHFIWQKMDYISPINDYKEKMFHIHFKDIRIETKKIEKAGILAYPLEYMTPKMPGLGDVHWGQFVSALTDIGYKGYACIEAEDRAFEGSREDVVKGLKMAKKYVEQFLG